MERLTLKDAINHSKKLAERHRWNSENTKPAASDEKANEVYKRTCIQYANQEEQYAKWFEELKTYKSLEEQGLLVRLPCKETYSRDGSLIYFIYDDDFGIVECMHLGLKIAANAKPYLTLAANEEIFPYRRPNPEQDLDPTDWCSDTIDVDVNEIGKTLFWTREEAEKKLEEMKKNE